MANKSPTYANDARTMVVAVSIVGRPRASVARTLDDERHQRDEERPGKENINVQQRDAQHRGRSGEEREERVVQRETAQQEKRDQTLSLEARFHHARPSAPAARTSA